MLPAINTIIRGDCLEIMKTWPDDFIDCIITSPPYDNIREYGKDWRFSPDKMFPEMLRILKSGGVCVWVVGDQVINKSESLTSFKQAICAVECGFNLHDTMIYHKNGFRFPDATRYQQVFEYMFVFSKGSPKTFNPLKRPTYYRGLDKTSTERNKDGTLTSFRYVLNETTIKDNVWLYEVGFMKSSKDPKAYEHPAIFPEKLVSDHMVSWTNEGDIVFDPFSGSGTTAIVAHRLNRNFLATEINADYVAIAQSRIDAERAQGKLF